MPYEDFPPLEERKTGAPNAATLDQATGAAQWGEIFGKGDTNLMLRKRHNQDIARETELMQQAQAAHQRDSILTSKLHQDAYFRGEKLDMDKEFGKARLEERAQKFQHEKEMFPITMAQRKAATTAAMGRTEAMAKADLWKEELHAQQAKDTVGFTEYVRASGKKRGTPEFAETLADARMKFPAMDHTLFVDVWKTHAGSELEPDEALKRFQDVQRALPGATVSGKLPGGVTVTERPAPDTTAKDQARLSARLSRLETLRGKPEDKLSKDQKDYYDEEINAVKEQMKGIAAPASAPAAGAAAPKIRKFNPETGKIE